MNERDLCSLKNMLMFAERINSRIKNLSLDQFLENVEKQDLILYPLGQLGENANRVSDELRQKYHEILWNPINRYQKQDISFIRRYKYEYCLSSGCRSYSCSYKSIKKNFASR